MVCGMGKKKQRVKPIVFCGIGEKRNCPSNCCLLELDEKTMTKPSAALLKRNKGNYIKRVTKKQL